VPQRVKSRKEPTLAEVFHEILRLARGQGGFVHGGADFDLDIVADRLGLPPDAIDTSYIDDGLLEYGERLKGATFELGRDSWVDVSLYKVKDPVEGGEYYAAVMVVNHPSGDYYEIHASEDQGYAEKAARALAEEALEIVKEHWPEEEYERAAENVRELFGVRSENE